MDMTTVQPQPGTEAAARESAFAIFGSDIPPVGPEDHDGSWRTALPAIAGGWADEGSG